jgi:DNA mismatch repair protein MutS
MSYRSIGDLVNKFQNSSISINNENQILYWFDSKQIQWSLDRIKTADPSFIHRTHPWTIGIYPELDMIENEWNTLIKEIEEFIKPFEAQGTPITLSMGDNTIFDFIITKKRFEKLPKSQFVFHAISSKSSTGILDSKEISEFHKRGFQIQKSWTYTQDKIWLKCLEEWSKSCDEIIFDLPISEFITKWIANLDTDFALARCAVEYDLITPKFIESETSNVVIEELRHPIIEQIHIGTPYIRHNLTLGLHSDMLGSAENGLLVYGSNASGKSSLMKSLGIAVICAQAGIPVAASKMSLSPYTGIFTRILGNDNLWASLSSFAVEMTEFRAILKYSNNRSLVLGDELCSGTETRSATAIVSAGIQTMVNRGAQFLLATHLHEISELEEIRNLRGVKFVHLGIEYDPKTRKIIYNRTLQEGSGSALYGLEVCYGLDMDEEFLNLATKSRQNLNKFSRYNSQVPVRNCEICKSEKSLESHHIIYQSDSNNGFIEPGSKIHRVSNLTVLCEYCHKEHHSGRLMIHGWIDSSMGRFLKWSRNQISPIHEKTPIGLSFEDIKDSLKMLLSKGKKEKEILSVLEKEMETKIKLSELRKWRKQLL